MFSASTHRSWLHPVPIIATLLCLVADSALAGNTGSLKGKVVSSETGEPVVNANIIEVDKSWGTATDINGDFFILNIPPGGYDVEISCLGFNTVTFTQVGIHVDLTTELKVELVPEAIKREEVKIVWEKPPVELGTTHTGRRFTKENIVNIRPEDVGTLLKTTTGFKEDAEGKWHVRGGRSGDVAILVDGVDIRDRLVDTQVRFELSSETLEEVNVLTGGLPAEYGYIAAVQFTTVEGSPKEYSGKIEYQTDRIIDTYSFDTDRMELSFGGPVPYSSNLFGKPVTFYISTIGRLSNTYLPFDVSRPANDYMGIGVKLPERQLNSYESWLKLGYDLTDTKKLTLYLKEVFQKWDIYPSGEGNLTGNYGYAYKYNIDNRPWAQNRQFIGSLTFTNQLSSKSWYELKLTTKRSHTRVQPSGKNPGEFTMQDDIEDEMAVAFDINMNGILDPGEYVDADGDGFMDGYWDANGNYIFDGGGEGYEDRNMNGRWDRGEDWVDLNGNGIYDAAEPWIDVVNPLTGENNIGVYDPWDSYSDVNGNGRWDPAEPQLPEQDWNGNGSWDGERFFDANGNGRYDPWEPWEDLNGNYLWDPGEPFIDTNGNGRFDYSEGYDDMNGNGQIDKRDLAWRASDGGFVDRNEPFIDGDFWWDTGEPFIDEPDPVSGEFNGRWDEGEIWFDLPSSAMSSLGAGDYFIGTERTLNGRYDGPNFMFDEYELFCRPADWNYRSDRSRPVHYTFDEQARGTDWPDDILQFIPGRSTWINRTLHDTEAPEFNMRNGTAEEDKEWFLDYNNDGKWNRYDHFLNDGTWDPTAYWQDRSITEYIVKFDIQSQVSKYHEIKSGVEIKYCDMEMQSIARPDLPYTNEAQLPEGSLWPERGDVRNFYHYWPWEGAVYVQDKMEFEGLIVNAGIRGDFIIQDQDLVDEYEERFLRNEPGAITVNRGIWRISPRLGISHPITEQSKLYFYYNHSYKPPDFQYFYKSATSNFDANSVLGNPNLEYEKTIQYELGVNTQISEYVVIDVHGYYKDQFGLIGTSDEKWKNINLERYVNLGYGRMRGFEFSIEKRPAHHYALTFNYDFSYAYGKESEQHASQEARLLGIPENRDEHPLNWDETHKVNANMTVHYDKGDHPRLLGLVLPDDWQMTLMWEFGSGEPYTPSEYTTGIENSRLILPNSARKPWRELTTLKFDKYYTLSARSGNRLFFGFTIDNLFNKRNVLAVHGQTGSPTEAVHPLNPAYDPNDNRQEWDANPRSFGSGRNVLFRIGMTF